MKKISFLAILGSLILLVGSCKEDFLDLKPLDQRTEAVYFKTPDQFKAFSATFYDKMLNWKSVDDRNVFKFMDFGSDLSSNIINDGFGGYLTYGRGVVEVPRGDKFWDNAYKYIRTVNSLLTKADEYEGDKDEIKQYVAEAKFFRAWHYFFLLKRFGGVPIITRVLDFDSPELYAARNSRYQVVDQILSDLSNAIPDLPIEQNIETQDKGRVSKWAAESFKARVLLFEATWERYVGTTTDGDGVAEGAGSVKPATYPTVDEMLTDAVSLSQDVMENGGYSLWNYNDGLDNRSNYFLFNIGAVDTPSNPLSLDKGSNKEFILQSVLDFDLRKSQANITRQSWLMAPSRKMLDMYLCTDGLPIDKSDKFMGYSDINKEFQNRDFRMLSNVLGSSALPQAGAMNLTDGVMYGWGNLKFTSWNTNRIDGDESQNYPQIRLAEVYLIYAESLYELNGQISDNDLNISLNKVRERAGVAPLTNSLVSTYGLNMLNEIRRERTLELYGENTRFNDLRRWGIAENELNQDVCTMVVGGNGYLTDFKDINGDPTSHYTPSKYGYGEAVVNTGDGELNCLVVLPASYHNFQRTHYLFPLPIDQLQRNSNLIQNSGY